MMKLSENVMSGLLEALEALSPSRVVAVVPSGSMLYNTVLPNRAFHDYDFVAFTEPFSSNKGVQQKFHGDYDLNFVDVSRMQEVLDRSTALTEALYGFQSDHAVMTDTHSVWFPYFNSFEQSVNTYFAFLGEVMRSHAHSLAETDDPDEGFSKRKHLTRWSLYMQRWGAGFDRMDPRLSEEEREEFLETLLHA